MNPNGLTQSFWHLMEIDYPANNRSFCRLWSEAEAAPGHGDLAQ
jgi:hypothetical protein